MIKTGENIHVLKLLIPSFFLPTAAIIMSEIREAEQKKSDKKERDGGKGKREKEKYEAMKRRKSAGKRTLGETVYRVKST